MSDEKKSFTVSDRRHFTTEGEARPGEQAEKPPATAEGDEARRAPPPPAPGTEAAAGPPVDFLGLLLSLGAQGAVLLGQGEAGPEGPPGDTEGARAVIALLEVLKDKSEGRRTPEEEAVLEDILFQLRMGYMARTRAGGA